MRSANLILSAAEGIQNTEKDCVYRSFVVYSRFIQILGVSLEISREFMGFHMGFLKYKMHI